MASNKWEEVPVEQGWEEVPIDQGIVPGDIAKKFAMGASYGFLPRLAGALEVGGQAVGIKGLGGTDLTNIELQKPDILEPSKLGEDYESAKRAYENALDIASQRSPKAALAAELAGGLMAPIPGGPATSLSAKAAKGAGIGALAGYGYSREDEEKLGRMALGGTIGAVAPVIAEKIIAPGIQKAGTAVGKFKGLLENVSQQFKTMPKPQAEEITAASQALGFEPSKAMLSESRQIAALEEGLTKGGGLVSTPYVERQQAIQEGLKRGTEKVGTLSTGRTPITIGEEMAGTLAEETDRLFAPSKELYQSVNKDLQKIPIDQGVAKLAFASAKRNDLFRSDQGRAFISEIQNQVGELSDIPSLMNYTRNFWKKIKPMGTPEENTYIEALYGTLKSIRDNSINAMKNDPMIKGAGKAGEQAVDEIIDNLSLADKMHESAMNEINSIRSLFGTSGKEFASPAHFKGKVSEQDFEKLAKQAAGTRFGTLSQLKEKFPDTFEKAKESMVNNILKQAESKGEVDLGKLVRQVNKLSPEAQDLIFDAETKALLKNLETVYFAFPSPVNPSGTSTMQRTWQSFTSPTKTVADYIASKALEGAGPKGSPFAQKAVQKVGEIEQKLSPGGSIYEAPRKTLETIPRIIQPGIRTETKEGQNKQDTSAILEKLKGSPYEQVLRRSLENGGQQSFAAANYVLKNRDENYRKLFGETEV